MYVLNVFIQCNQGFGQICISYFQTQTNMYEIVMEMNARQATVEQRVDTIESNLNNLAVSTIIITVEPVLKSPCNERPPFLLRPLRTFCGSL